MIPPASPETTDNATPQKTPQGRLPGGHPRAGSRGGLAPLGRPRAQAEEQALALIGSIDSDSRLDGREEPPSALGHQDDEL